MCLFGTNQLWDQVGKNSFNSSVQDLPSPCPLNIVSFSYFSHSNTFILSPHSSFSMNFLSVQNFLDVWTYSPPCRLLDGVWLCLGFWDWVFHWAWSLLIGWSASSRRMFVCLPSQTDDMCVAPHSASDMAAGAHAWDPMFVSQTPYPLTHLLSASLFVEVRELHRTWTSYSWQRSVSQSSV